MCGIYGSSSLERFKTLYDLNFERGNFAYGALYKTGVPWKHYIKKHPGKCEITILKEYEFYLGHTQSPTSSEREFKPETSHPFEYGEWAVAHNGVLSNFDNLKERFGWDELTVDTSIIPRLLHHFDIEDEVSAIEKAASTLEGTFGCWIYDKYSTNTYLIRSGSTLHTNSSNGDFSSKKYPEMELLEEGVIYKIINNSEIQKVGTFKCNSPYFIL